MISTMFQYVFAMPILQLGTILIILNAIKFNSNVSKKSIFPLIRNPLDLIYGCNMKSIIIASYFQLVLVNIHLQIVLSGINTVQYYH